MGGMMYNMAGDATTEDWSIPNKCGADRIEVQNTKYNMEN